MRAFPIALSTRSTPTDVLYPGCIVDVFATFTLRGKDSAADAVVVPLLQKVQVLGIRGDTVMTSQQPNEKSGSRQAASSGTATVTLEVTSAQVSALQLALQGGTLGIALRNPNDEGFESMEPMSRKGGRMSVDPETLALLRRIHETLGKESALDPNTLNANDSPLESTKPVISPSPLVEDLPPILPEVRPTGRSVTVIRAQKQEEVEVKDTEPNEPAQSTHAMGADNR